MVERKPVQVPENMSSGEVVRFLLEQQPDFVNAADEAHWREVCAPRRCVLWRDYEIMCTPPSGLIIKISGLDLELRVSNEDDLVPIMNGLADVRDSTTSA